MMSERRALLDPEMYKISEEDSQDEEVLASYTDEALRLGGGDRGGEDSANGNIISSSGRNINNNNSVPHHSRGSWSNPGDNSRWLPRQQHQEEEDSGGTWEFSGDFSSVSQFNPSKLRIVHGVHHQHLRQRSTAIRLGAHNGDDPDNGVDWPDTSTNSDSCLSGGDDGARRSQYPVGSAAALSTGGYSGTVSDGRYLSKTYFGDHLATKRDKGGRLEDQDSNDEGTGAHGRGVLRGGYNNHHGPPDYPPRPQEGRSRGLQKRSRRQQQSSRNNELSSSGSEYSDDQQGNDDESSISSSGSSSSPCTVCLNTKGRDHHHGHGRHHNRHRRHITSSSEVEEYDSSYSDSSYDDENEDDNEVDYDDYDDDDDENECFDDVVKFLGDEEVASSTNADGDLFLVEYSGDESEDGVRSAAVASDTLPSTSHPESSGTLTFPSTPKNPTTEKNGDGTEGREQVPASESRRNSADGSTSSPADAGALSTAHPSPVPPSLATRKEGSVQLQKTPSEKDTKGQGRISRLLKRKRTTALSAFLKTPVDSHPGATGESTLPLEQTPSEISPATPAVVATNLTSVPPTSSPCSSKVVEPGRKQKGPSTSASVGSSSRGSAPEKVFRFKDEHGGETRTVFVDIPQSARTGNLLGRRATLIESILGILPGHFSTPPSTSQLQEFSPQDQNFMSVERIMVAGFVPDGIASKYRRIKIGDWLQCVDDIPIDHGNVDQVLNSRSMYGKRRTAFETEYLRLKLTLRRVAGCMVSLPPSSSPPGAEASSTLNLPLKNSSTTCITEPCWSAVSPQVQSNVVVLFISNGGASGASSNSTNSAKDEDSQSPSSSSGQAASKSKDVVYSWPLETESKMAKALVASQGMFSTMYRLLWDVTGSHPVVSRVVIDDCEMDVTYTSDDHGTSLLLVGVATSLSTFTVYRPPQQPQQQKGKPDSSSGAGTSSSPGGPQGSGSNFSGEGKKKEKKIRWREPQSSGVTVSVRVLNRLESLLKYQFGSFERAFSDGNLDKVNRILVNSLAALNDLSEDFIQMQVPGNFLRFPNCIRSGIDDVLYSFETSDALRGSRSSGKSNRCGGASSTSFSRGSTTTTANDTPGLPVYHCHGSCLMYKGFLISSHLENDIASAFHGWWRTQLGLWAGVKRNAILDRWKPVSRMALWQETCILKKTFNGPPKNVDVPPAEMGSDTGDIEPPKIISCKASTARCFSGLVGIGNFTLGFVLEHLTDYPGSVGPDIYWLRRAMATICRLYQSGLSRSFECWMDEKQGGREEYVELCGTSPPSSSSKPPPEKSGGGGGTALTTNSSRTATTLLPLKKAPFTGSILKNTESSPSSSSHHPYCALHSPSTVVNTPVSTASPASCTCSQFAGNSSPFSKSSSSTGSSTSSSFGGNGGVRSGVSSLDDFSPGPRHNPVSGDPAANYESDGGGDEQDADDTTTGTGSDNSSFKWYERAASEHNNSGPSRSSSGDVKHIRVSRGNVLIDYMLVEFGRGVMLTSKDIHGGWAAAVRHNFRQSATVIHHILHKAANARFRLEERGQDKKWVSLTLAPISEHGILFHCQITDPRDIHKKKPRKRDISYWVVGRIYPDEREIYVCYEDGSLSQNLVEIAYKIALNVHT